MSVKRKKSQARPRGGASLLCPKCKKVTRTRDTRRMPDGAIRRERVCSKKHVTVTTEWPDTVSASVG